MSLVSVGTVAFDAIETPFGKTDKIIGGACTYISLAASFFSKGAKIISVVGGDFPQNTLDMFAEKGINTEGLQIVKDGKTFFWASKEKWSPADLLGRPKQIWSPKTNLDAHENFLGRQKK